MDEELRKQLDETIRAIDEDSRESAPALNRDSARFRVDAVLKESDAERTERVYLVEDASEQGPFIRKTFVAAAGTGNAYKRLLDAQRAGKRFAHLPHILSCTQNEGSCTVLMEYIAGHTLSDEVYQADASPQLAARFFPQICDAVAELHEGFAPPIIHRDIKPSNIMVAWNGVYLIDLGIARSFSSAAQDDTLHLGTKAYAPPEQFGYSQTDERSDVYALGMLLYYLLTEKNPDPALAGGPFEEDGIPKTLRPVLQKATSFDPANRYQSVRSLKAAFLEAASISPLKIDDEENALFEAPEKAAPSNPFETNANRAEAGPGTAFAADAKRDLAGGAQQKAAANNPSAPAPAQARTRKSKRHGLLGAVPKPLGVIVDAACALWIVFVGIAAVATVIDPADGSFSTMALPVRIIACAITAIFLLTPLVLVVDRRPLYRFFPALQAVPLRRQIGLGAAVAVACMLAMGALSCF